MHTVDPALPLYALTEPTKFYPGSPWLAGLNPLQYGDSVVLTAKSLGARAIEPLAALPLTGSAELPLVDTHTIEQAHAHGMLVIRWPHNDAATMHALAGSRRRRHHHRLPDRLREVLQERGMPLPQQYL
ncbi:hypothetical protein [Nocardia carnea]|uniref:hypothetical protein n=1 Tax=Nocardia carnea TaxID=37328 RepID=UPI0024561296|nr:hypothetical protein [Nocardia carnea]